MFSRKAVAFYATFCFLVLVILVLFRPQAEMKNVGIDLFSRHASVQVSSAQHSLTSVFGMGTGGPCAVKTPTFSFIRLLSTRMG